VTIKSTTDDNLPLLRVPLVHSTLSTDNCPLPSSFSSLSRRLVWSGFVLLSTPHYLASTYKYIDVFRVGIGWLTSTQLVKISKFLAVRRSNKKAPIYLTCFRHQR
jgi:hypothetical protein